MNTDANTKIQMLNGSMRCFIYGLLALIPVLGLPFAVGALWISGQVRAKEKLFWNAAQPYRIWGVVWAGAGTVFWAGVLTIVIYHAVNNFVSGD
ncbi:MAG: hypothetical protein WCS42_03680 [Verrucomicrobiota bacterium]